MMKHLLNKLTRIFTGPPKLDSDPVFHHFPNLGAKGEITLSCSIWPSPRPGDRESFTNKDLHSGVERIGPKCVGSLIVELDQFGLTLRWKPGDSQEEAFLSPFSVPTSGQPAADPFQQALGKIKEAGTVKGHGPTIIGIPAGHKHDATLSTKVNGKAAA